MGGPFGRHAFLLRDLFHQNTVGYEACCNLKLGGRANGCNTRVFLIASVSAAAGVWRERRFIAESCCLLRRKGLALFRIADIRVEITLLSIRARASTSIQKQ